MKASLKQPPSPLPWMVRPAKQSPGKATIYNAGDGFATDAIACLEFCQPKDWDFMIKAVNCHAELVRQLQDAVNCIEEDGGSVSLATKQILAKAVDK